MEITKRGSVKSGFEGKWSCIHCKSEWTMNSGDQQPQFISDRDGNAYHMPCPVCKAETYRATSVPMYTSVYDR